MSDVEIYCQNFNYYNYYTISIVKFYYHKYY